MTTRKRGEPIIRDPLTGQSKPKGTTEFSKRPEDIAKTPVKTVPGWSERTKSKQAAMEAAKPPRRPLGHSEPIPEGKLAPLVEAAASSSMPMPSWAEEGLKDLGELPEPPLPPPPPETPKTGGVGSGLRANREAMTAPKPMSMADLKRSAQEAPPMEESEPEMDEEAQEPQEREEEAPFFPQFTGNPIFLKKKKEIEGRLHPLTFADLITKQELTQEIPVLPDQLSFVFRTYSEAELLWIQQYLYEKVGLTTNVHSSELDGMYKVVLSLVSLNGRSLPTHLDNDGNVDREKFEKKFRMVSRFPTSLIGEIGLQLQWFQERVAKLFNVEDLKNG